MRAVVLGGGGLTGQVAVRALAAGTVFTSVVAADLDRALAERAAAATQGRATSERVDLREAASLDRTLAGADVVVNAAPYPFHLEAMEGALRARVAYLDFGGLFHTTRRQLDLDGRFRAAGVLAIPGLGQVPGISNVLVAEATKDLDRVDSVTLRDGWRDLAVGGPELAFSWSPSTFLDEMVLPAVRFEQGAYREEPPLSGAEEYTFLPPVGRTRVYRTLHSEPATLPGFLAAKGLRRCEWKEGGPGIELLHALAQLGLGSDRPLAVDGASVAPRAFLLALLRREGLVGVRPGTEPNDWEVLDVAIEGTLGGAPATRHAVARFPPRPDWRFSATEYAVGVAGAIGAEMIARGEIRGAGVVPPERAVPGARFRELLAEWGIRTAITPPEPSLADDPGPLPRGSPAHP